MANPLTNRKFIHFNKLENFENQLQNNPGSILDTQIVFIKDARKIWTHGTYYTLDERITNDIYSKLEALAEISTDIIQKLDEAQFISAGPTADRPTGGELQQGICYLDTDLNEPIWWDGTNWIDAAGNNADLPHSGTTAQRPNIANVKIGFDYLDTTTGKFFISDGTQWVHIANSVISDITYSNNKISKTNNNGNTTDVVTVSLLKTDMALNNVGNFKAVSTEANQSLTDTEKSNARTNIGAIGELPENISYFSAYSDETVVPVPGEASYTKSEIDTALANKQDTVSDLSAIRSGAQAGSTAYQKPQGGIPSTDMSQDVQTSLDKANTALQEHQSLDAYAKIDGYYEGMGVGTADNLTGQTERTDDAMYRKTGGSEEVASGTATISNIKGQTIAWNLLLNEGKLVDMGLPSGTLWASCNIDITQPDGFAASPFQYECSFFSWGNVDGHNPISNTTFDYDWGSINSQDPYYEGQVYGDTQGNTLTGDIPVDDTYDAARVNVGSLWRMPTSAEFAELFANIKYINADGTEVGATKGDKRVNVNGILGLYLESKINGARLFFSCSGVGSGRSWGFIGSYGYYWSSAFFSARYARSLSFGSGGVLPQGSYGRYDGFALRPVITKSALIGGGKYGHKYALSSNNTNITDVTLTYGAGNEPTTVAQFEADYFKWFGKPLTYEDYDAGSLRSVQLDSLKTTGFNQYNNGQARVIGGLQYQITGTYTTLYPTVALTDYTYGNTVTVGTYYTNNNNHFVGAKNVSTYDNTATYALGGYCAYDGAIYKSNVAIETAEEFDATHWDIIADIAAMVTEGILTLWDITPDANGLFTPSTTGTLIVTGGGNDTCIHISGDRNGEYEPYEEHSVSLPVTTITGKLNGEGESVVVFPDGMKSAGSVYDEIYTVGDKTYAVKRVGSMNLGTLSGATSTTNLFSLVFPEIPTATSSTEVLNGVVNKKYQIGLQRNWPDVNYQISRNNNTGQSLLIRDTDYNDFASLKAFLTSSSVTLYYALETPQVYELDTFDLPKPYQVDNNGTEEQIQKSGVQGLAAILTILYSVDAVGILNKLPQNYISEKSMDNFLAQLNTVTGGTWAKTWNENTGEWDFSFTANAQTNDTNTDETI